MNLKELRKSQHLTQEEFAKEIGISRDTYKNYEQERTQMPYQMLIKIADFYNISLDFLLGRQNKNLIFTDSLSPEKKELINMIKNLNDDETLIVIGYISKLTNKPIDEVMKNIKQVK